MPGSREANVCPQTAREHDESHNAFFVSISADYTQKRALALPITLVTRECASVSYQISALYTCSVCDAV